MATIEQILSLVVHSFDASPLSVVELTVLASTNVHYYQMEWPRRSFLWGGHCQLRLEQNVMSKLECLGERLRRPVVARAAQTLVKGAAGLCTWAAEDRCRAAWAVAAMLSSVPQGSAKLGNKEYMLRFLASGLVSPAPCGVLSTAAAVFSLASVSPPETLGLLKEAGVGNLLAQFVEHESACVQKVALETITYAGGHELGFPSSSIPTVISIAASGCYNNQLAALEAIDILTDDREETTRDSLKGAIPTVVKLLHGSKEIKQVAAWALNGLVNAVDDDRFAIEACKLGCVPTLIDNWVESNYSWDATYGCLERISMGDGVRNIALQHGILPVLFQSLAQGQDVSYLLAYYRMHVPHALMRETAAQRQAVVYQLTAMKGSISRTDRRQLLELLEEVG